jgi:hypothetical protein
VWMSNTRNSDLEDRIVERLSRRSWPILVSIAYIALGLAYWFRWGSIVRHTPSEWVSPGDLWTTYQASSALAHGHFGSIYGSGFLALPGILVALAPLGAFSNAFGSTFIEISNHGHPVVGLHNLLVSGTPYNLDLTRVGSKLYAVHQQAFILLAPVVLALSAFALFAFDALAERLQVTRSRRALLCVVEAVLLWNVTVFSGHPEDAVAVALAAYALILALDGRFTGAGWLFGAALAVQPLVIVLFPLLIVLGGRRRALGLALRSVIPAAALTIAPLASDVSTTVHALVTQPGYPKGPNNHQTPWTFLAPKLSGQGVHEEIGGGPTRAFSLVLAVAVGWWALRWRGRPEMIVWAAALALALRTYTESVMTDYYTWPALAVGVLVAARGTKLRFSIAIACAIGTTIVSQWHLGLYPWWALQAVGVTGLLAAAAKPAPTEEPAEPARSRAPTAQARGGSSKSKQKRKKKTARADRKRTARR